MLTNTHTASHLAHVLAAVLLLPGAGCSRIMPNPVDTGDGIDLFGDLELAGGIRPSCPKQERVRYPGLVLAAVDPSRKKPHVVDSSTVGPDAIDAGWHYGIILAKGDYDLLVFADRNNDGTVHRTDLVGSAKVHVVQGPSDAPGMLRGPTIRVDLAHPTDAGFDLSIAEHRVEPLRASLDDRFFDAKWGLRGLIWPSWVLHHTDDQFLFGLRSAGDPEEYRRQRAKMLEKVVPQGKTQVLFVHGIDDTPRAFTALSKLDPARYQAWFFFYPTGLGLEQTGSELAEDAKALSEKADTVLVAHSMGGLIARQAIKVLALQNASTFPLKGYLSLATPYGGMESANGMNSIPRELLPYVKRQSLFDVQPESAFLTRVHQGWPEGLSFYLFWGHAKADGDGTVKSESATDSRAASHAVDVCEYHLDHTGMLAKGNETVAEDLLGDFKHAIDLLASGMATRFCSGKAAQR